VPEKKQYVSEDAHEGIVSRDVFERAQAAVQMMNKPEYKMVNPYLLRGKVRCGSCNLAMSCVEQAGQSVFYCSHKLNTGKYSNCSSAGVSSEKVEATVLQAIRDKVTGKQLTREMVEEFVEMVYVYNGERIEVVVK
jgi:uncharacterized protein CbrC (UPF0167 family)